MSCKIKSKIIGQIWEKTIKCTKLATQEQLASHFALANNKQRDQLEWQLNLPLKFFRENEKEIESFHVQVQSESIPGVAENITSVEHSNFKRTLNFEVDRNNMVQDVLDSDPVALNFKPNKSRLIVEYSSPNIAKPFHVGHLRSTIIGNFIANLKKKLGKSVVKINYLGDWGTQFGLLKLGVEMMNYSDDALKQQPIKLMFDAYVKANQEADKNPDIFTQARGIFQKLEEGDKECRETWNKFREFTIDELKGIYKRTGVEFDEYHWESLYGKEKVQPVLTELEDQALLGLDEKGRTVAHVLGKPLPLLKSDGSTLYLLRDIAAIVDRRSLHDFDEMYYVVENGQSDHFHSLFALCREMGVDKAWNLRHVKFGRVHGMSTRRGNVVFLKDILDEARDIMFQKQLEAKTTKVKVTDETADILGTSAVFINDLKQRRLRDYEFSWDKALQTTGDSGIRMQYAHCRLVSLLANSGASVAKECDPHALPEPEVTNLVLELARFEESLLRANEDLEACALVTYLFQLCHAINKAFKALPVKGSGVHVSSQRMLLFNQSRLVLAEGMRILGITPLNQM